MFLSGSGLVFPVLLVFVLSQIPKLRFSLMITRSYKSKARANLVHWLGYFFLKKSEWIWELGEVKKWRQTCKIALGQKSHSTSYHAKWDKLNVLSPCLSVQLNQTDRLWLHGENHVHQGQCGEKWKLLENCCYPLNLPKMAGRGSYLINERIRASQKQYMRLLALNLCGPAWHGHHHPSPRRSARHKSARGAAASVPATKPHPSRWGYPDPSTGSVLLDFSPFPGHLSPVSFP